jgi:hypothetical protein
MVNQVRTVPSSVPEVAEAVPAGATAARAMGTQIFLRAEAVLEAQPILLMDNPSQGTPSVAVAAAATMAMGTGRPPSPTQLR